MLFGPVQATAGPLAGRVQDHQVLEAGLEGNVRLDIKHHVDLEDRAVGLLRGVGVRHLERAEVTHVEGLVGTASLSIVWAAGLRRTWV